MYDTKMVEPFEDWKTASDANEEVVEEINDLLPELYLEDPAEFELIGKHILPDYEGVKRQAEE